MRYIVIRATGDVFKNLPALTSSCPPHIIFVRLKKMFSNSLVPLEVYIALQCIMSEFV